MQQLIFDPAWDNSLSIKDRQRIEQTFENTREASSKLIEIITLWHAVNHRDDLLVTALIHNRGENPLTFMEQTLQYTIDHTVIGEHIFTIPTIKLPAKTSMPWTFIFPKGTWHNLQDKLGKISM